MRAVGFILLNLFFIYLEKPTFIIQESPRVYTEYANSVISEMHKLI
ncbi:hypothetical protein NIES4106_20610 [Fischerella sp. NIES-4106]|nr:hypothetical protein NIES4106_20610 [Fischerella sp. NIES-4106]